MSDDFESSPPTGGGVARTVVRRAAPPRPYTPSPWTKERDEELVRHWIAGGRSTAAIGLLMGLTKNQVIGRAYRLNLPRKEASVPYAPRTPQPRIRPHVVQVSMPPIAKRADLEPPREYKTAPSLVDVREDQCKFPIEEKMWCGRPRAERSPYCVEHHRVCYQRGK